MCRDIVDDACVKSGLTAHLLFLAAYQTVGHPLDEARHSFNRYLLGDKPSEVVVNYCLGLLVPRTKKEVFNDHPDAGNRSTAA